MALTVEDGSGVADAEAYISVTDADAYFAGRGDAMWAALDTATKEQNLRKGAEYLESFYRWRGSRATTTQALSWPRQCVTVDDVAVAVAVASDAVPVAIQRANAQLAVRASAGDLAGDEGPQVKQETVGPISVTYADGARQNPRYAAVDALVAPYTRGGGAVQVVRA